MRFDQLTAMGNFTFFPVPSPYFSWTKLIGPFVAKTVDVVEARPVILMPGKGIPGVTLRIEGLF